MVKLEKAFNNKTKGFTLTELLGVVAILAIISAIAITVFLKVKDNVLQKDYENIIAYLETEAENYAKDTGITTTTVENLIREGYVNPDDETDIYNPITNESLNCYLISTTMENGIYNAKIGKNIGSNNGTCNSYEKEQNLKICILSDDEKTCSDITNDWLNNNVTLGVKDYKGNIITSNENIYKWQSNDGNTSDGHSIKTNTELVSNNVYTVEITFSDDKVGKASAQLKIDKQAPVVLETDVYPETNDWTNEKRVKLNVSDYSGSGVYGVLLTGSKITNCSNNKNDYTKLNGQTTTEIKLAENNNYICLIDNAGNPSDEVLLVKAEKIDTTGADYINLKASTTSYVKSLNLIGTARDDKSGLVAYQFTTSSTTPTTNWVQITRTNQTITKNKTNITENGTYYFWVKDYIGNISSAKVQINNIDKVVDSVTITRNDANIDYPTSSVLTLKATDNLSGIVKYKVTTSSAVPTSGWTTVANTKSLSTTYTVNENETYYFWVQDAAGNTAYKSININNIVTLAYKTDSLYSRKSSDIDGSLYISDIVKLDKVTTSTGRITDSYMSGRYAYYSVSGGTTYSGYEEDVCEEDPYSYDALEKEYCVDYYCKYGGDVDGDMCVGDDYELRTGHNYWECLGNGTWDLVDTTEQYCDEGYTKGFSCDAAKGSCTPGDETTTDCDGWCTWDGDYSAKCDEYDIDYYCDYRDEVLDYDVCYGCYDGYYKKGVCYYDCEVKYTYWEYDITISYYKLK